MEYKMVYIQQNRYTFGVDRKVKLTRTIKEIENYHNLGKKRTNTGQAKIHTTNTPQIEQENSNYTQKPFIACRHAIDKQASSH